MYLAISFPASFLTSVTIEGDFLFPVLSSVTWKASSSGVTRISAATFLYTAEISVSCSGITKA